MGNLFSKLAPRESQPVIVPSDQVQASSSLQLHDVFEMYRELARAALETTQPTSCGNSTFPFTKLPPEIRIMIWKEARPKTRRLLTSSYQSSSGSRFLPSPPAIAHVCRESRRVALIYGSWHSPKYGGVHGGWFNPAEDVVIWISLDDASQRRGMVNHSVNHLAVVWNPFTTSGSLVFHQWHAFSAIKHIARDRTKWENLRTIDLVISPHDEYLLDDRWEYTVIEEMFGDDTVVTVDLQDEKECSRAIDLLRRDPRSQHQLDLLSVARHVARDHQDHRIYSWAKILEIMQYKWLECSYQRDNGRVADAILVKEDKAKWDLDHPWIKRTLAGMPELRPIFILARRDHTWKLNRAPIYTSLLNNLG